MATTSLTGAQFANELARARKGDHIVYHIGVLMADRVYDVEVDSVARAAWQAHVDDKVRLFQRRVRPSACQYVAVVR